MILVGSVITAMLLELLPTLKAWHAADHRIALATVVETWGSAPRRAGAVLAVRADMAFVGSVSGGCVEGAVIEEALTVLQGGPPCLVTYGVSDDSAWEVGLACGGTIRVWVEPIHAGWLSALDHAATVQRDTAQILYSLTASDGPFSGEKMLVWEDGQVVYVSGGLPDKMADRWSAMTAATSAQTAKMVALDETKIFVDAHSPAPHLILVGGAHVGVALQEIAPTLGFRVILVDPRRAFATAERFPRVESILYGYPQVVFPHLKLDRWSYVVVLTHDPKIDDPALIAALASPAPYIGVMSSRQTHQARVERLRAAGVDEKSLGRIRAPIGLDIHARTPSEIAVAILAEIIATANLD